MQAVLGAATATAQQPQGPDPFMDAVLQAAGQAHGPVSVGEKIAAGAKATGAEGVKSFESLGAALARPFIGDRADKLKNHVPAMLEQDPVVESAMTPEERMTTIGAGGLAGGFAPALIPGIGQAGLAAEFALLGGERAREVNAQHPDATEGQKVANILLQAGIGGLAGLGPAGALTRDGGEAILPSIGREVLGGGAVGFGQDL